MNSEDERYFGMMLYVPRALEEVLDVETVCRSDPEGRWCEVPISIRTHSLFLLVRHLHVRVGAEVGSDWRRTSW